MSIEGSFSITQWDEDTLSERSEGIKVSHASIKQVYSGEMSGESSVEFLMSYQSPMSAKFTGFETFVGVVNGLRGTVIFQHSGKFENGIASSDFESIKDAATGELASKTFRGSFKSRKSGKADYTLEADDV
ncbi:DUF3224 domain-containing protein [Alteromonas sp. ALT199]|uniref:DUF3224 domain-containing protein n=1 Tax=unclassified Alteromonas TaxID=2614992 RepID=UPI0004512AD2|nr:DUF3224 domain-containing protein [Alteromonas sp. ALT199]MBT3134254.1 DUF3224 domain-containing protein [Alteromonas sp. ALT199]